MAAAVAPRPVRVAIAEAQGLMCAEEVVTERPLPGFDQAAIDGYAVRSVDVSEVGEGGDLEDGDVNGIEVRLPVVGDIEAGARTPSRLQPRQAARVQTGAPLPTLADAVLPLRWAGGGTARVRVLRGGRGGVPPCVAPGTTSSPATSPCGPERSSARRRSGCWRRSGASGSWCIRARGCRWWPWGG